MALYFVILDCEIFLKKIKKSIDKRRKIRYNESNSSREYQSTNSNPCGRLGFVLFFKTNE